MPYTQKIGMYHDARRVQGVKTAYTMVYNTLTTVYTMVYTKKTGYTMVYTMTQQGVLVPDK